MVEKIIFEGDTESDHYIVAESVYNGRAARVLYANNRLAAQSGLALDGISEMLFDYNERFLEIVRATSPKRILLIGGGGFTLPTALINEFPDAYLDIIEIDGGLLDISKDHFGFKPNKRTRIYIGDGAIYLNSSEDKYDLIVIDVFKEEIIPQSFQTEQIARVLKSRLTAKGIVAMNVISAYYGQRSKVLRRIMEVISPHFKDVNVYPAGSGLNLWIPQNFLLVAYDVDQKLEHFLRYMPVDVNN
jgi:spermidine synthase